MLQGRDDRLRLDAGAQRGDLRLELVGVPGPRLPGVVDRADAAGVHVPGRGDAAAAAVAEVVEEKRLGAREHPEAGVRGEEGFGVGPVAGAVLEPDHDLRERVDEAPDEIDREPDHRLGRDVVEVDAKARVRDPVDDLAEVLEHPVVAHPLEVERRQHHDPAAAGLDRVTAELHRVRDGAQARPRHEPSWVDSPFEQRIEQAAGARRARGTAPLRWVPKGASPVHPSSSSQAAWSANRAGSGSRFAP